MDISESNYCKTGLGVGTEQCACKLKLKTVRRLQGNGPGLSELITESINQQPQEPTLIVPDSVQSKIELAEFLQSQGLDRNTPEYVFLFKKYGQNLIFKR
jgi:hypothetical protein